MKQAQRGEGQVLQLYIRLYPSTHFIAGLSLKTLFPVGLYLLPSKI